MQEPDGEYSIQFSIGEVNKGIWMQFFKGERMQPGIQLMQVDGEVSEQVLQNSIEHEDKVQIKSRGKIDI